MERSRFDDLGLTRLPEIRKVTENFNPDIFTLAILGLFEYDTYKVGSTPMLGMLDRFKEWFVVVLTVK